MIVGEPMSFERYGCMVRKGDAPFKAVVDGALDATFKNSEIDALYKKNIFIFWPSTSPC